VVASETQSRLDQAQFIGIVVDDEDVRFGLHKTCFVLFFIVLARP
jgi:hypothetical protein